MRVSVDVKNELIVLIHGFGAKRTVMWPLAYRLGANGFRVDQWRYPTLFATIESHASRLRDYLSTQLMAESRFHIVAHSMGSIVTRAALNRTRLPNLGRIVMLAPPNCGSPVARIASKLVGSIVVPTRELSDCDSSYVKKLQGPNDLDIGIIAASHDLLVPISNTHFAGETKHATLIATHNSLLFSKTACDKTVRFIRNGNFDTAN